MSDFDDTIPENIDLRWLARHVLALRADVRDIKDDLLVQGAILARLDHRDRTADSETLKLLQMVQRLTRRVEALEEKTET